MSDVSSWIYCRVVDGGYWAISSQPYWLGMVEFSRIDAEDPASRGYLVDSLEEFGTTEGGSRPQNSLRARTWVSGVTCADAMRLGESEISEAIELMNARVLSMGSALRLLSAGYAQDILTGSTVPIQKESGQTFIGNLHLMDDAANGPRWILNLLLAAPMAFGELGQAFRRSFHWGQLARKAHTRGESILLNMLAAEALCVVRSDPLPKLLAVAGFPGGNMAKEAASIGYSSRNNRTRRKRLVVLMDKMREVRNQIVHEGFRDTDMGSLLSVDEEKEGALFLELSVRSLHDFAFSQLDQKRFTIAEMWDSWPNAWWLEHARGNAPVILSRLAACRDEAVDHTLDAVVRN